MKLPKVKQRFILLAFFISWLLVSFIWRDRIFGSTPETLMFPDPPKAEMRMFSSRIEAEEWKVEEAPMKESKTESPVETMKIIFTSLIVFANLLGGSIFLWQKS
jgi:hypothetical protein